MKSKTKVPKINKNIETHSISKSLSTTKENNSMQYLSKKDQQEERYLENTINPYKIDYFDLCRLMTLYSDNPHQQFISNHWNCLYTRLSKYWDTKTLIKAKMLNKIFKKKIRAKEHVKKGTKKLFNGLTNSFRKHN